MAVTFFREIVEPWGRVQRLPHQVAHPRHADELPGLMAQALAADACLLATGLHRSYGDSGLNPEGRVISIRGLDRFLAFDSEGGVLRAEAGVSLDEILQLIVPRGWFLPTTPGTRFVTLGGAVANDVHGKNHHRAGSFGCHVRRLGLLRSDLGALEVSAHSNPDLFHATLGGLGLTGLITWVEIDLTPIASSQLDQESIAFDNLEAFFALNQESEASFEHVSAWVDCTAGGRDLGRGVLFRANWAPSGRLKAHSIGPNLMVPIEAPGGLFNGLTLRAFNTAIRVRESFRPRCAAVSYTSAFHPLDAIGGWNRLYGPKGFYQHQAVVPLEGQQEAMAEVLRTIVAAGQGSFLAVLKTLGPLRSGGLISFRGPGTSLALDFPNRGPQTLALLDRLDAIVMAAGGCIYPAKDGRMSAQTFRAGYPRWGDLERQRDPLFNSSFWSRVTR